MGASDGVVVVQWWCFVEGLRGLPLAARSIAATQPALSDRSRRHQVHCCVRQYSRKYPAQGGRSGRIDSHPPGQISWKAVESGSCRRPRPTQPPSHPSRRSPFLCVSGGGSDQSCRWCLAMTMYVVSKSQVHGWRRSPRPTLDISFGSGQNICLDQTGNGNTQWSTGVPVSLYVQPGHVPATGINLPRGRWSCPSPARIRSTGTPQLPQGLMRPAAYPK